MATLKSGCHQVEGNSIKWQNWHIRHSFNYREGLVLHDVGYEDGGKVRPVMHRGSLVEMCVPYADPNPPFQRKCAFDVSPTPKALQSEIGPWNIKMHDCHYKSQILLFSNLCLYLLWYISPPRCSARSNNGFA